MKPLSIEEIKNLEVGDWVWLTDSEGHLGRYVVKAEAPIEEDDKTFNFDSLSGSWTYDYSYYGTKWLAYKNKEQAECDNSYDLLKVKYEIVLKEYAKLKRKATKYNFMTKTIDKEITKQAEQKLKELRGEL